MVLSSAAGPSRRLRTNGLGRIVCRAGRFQRATVGKQGELGLSEAWPQLLILRPGTIGWSNVKIQAQREKIQSGNGRRASNICEGALKRGEV
jgi:hypothetical protein